VHISYAEASRRHGYQVSITELSEHLLCQGQWRHGYQVVRWCRVHVGNTVPCLTLGHIWIILQHPTPYKNNATSPIDYPIQPIVCWLEILRVCSSRAPSPTGASHHLCFLDLAWGWHVSEWSIRGYAIILSIFPPFSNKLVYLVNHADTGSLCQLHPIFQLFSNELVYLVNHATTGLLAQLHLKCLLFSDQLVYLVNHADNDPPWWPCHIFLGQSGWLAVALFAK